MYISHSIKVNCSGNPSCQLPETFYLGWGIQYTFISPLVIYHNFIYFDEIENPSCDHKSVKIWINCQTWYGTVFYYTEREVTKRKKLCIFLGWEHLFVLNAMCCTRILTLCRFDAVFMRCVLSVGFWIWFHWLKDV